MARGGNTVRNVVLGCAVVLLLATVVAGFAVYHFVWKPGRELVAGGAEAIESIEELGRLEEGVEDQTPYAAPADRLLEAGQVERFVAVQEQVRGELGPRFAELEQRIEAHDGTGNEPSLTEMIGFWRDLGELAVEAKREQVAALNAQGFSLAEYDWVREQVYLALGLEQMAIGMDEIAAVMEDQGLAGLEQLSELEDQSDLAAPPENRALVEPHRAQLEEWAPLAMLGM